MKRRLAPLALMGLAAGGLAGLSTPWSGNGDSANTTALDLWLAPTSAQAAPIDSAIRSLKNEDSKPTSRRRQQATIGAQSNAAAAPNELPSLDAAPKLAPVPQRRTNDKINEAGPALRLAEPEFRAAAQTPGPLRIEPADSAAILPTAAGDTLPIVIPPAAVAQTSRIEPVAQAAAPRRADAVEQPASTAGEATPPAALPPWQSTAAPNEGAISEQPAELIDEPADTAAATAAVNQPATSTTPTTAARTAPGATDGDVTVAWRTPSTVSVGQEAACQLAVQNLGQSAAQDVTIVVDLPEAVEAPRCEPKAEVAGRRLTWNIGEMAGGETKTIDVALVMSSQGRLTPRASVTFTRASAAEIEIVEPELQMSIAAPSEAVVGRPVSCELTVMNTGSGSARNVSIELQLAEGLYHAQGQSLAYRFGALGPGETRTMQLPLFAAEPGSYEVLGSVVMGGRSVAQANCQLELSRPALEVIVDGPKLRYVDRKADFVIKVQNPGPAPIDNVQVVETVPAGFRFVEATAGGSFDPAARQVAWFVGRLEPNQTAEVGVQLIASETGSQQFNVTAASDLGVIGEGQTTTEVQGVPAVVLDIVEDDDPIEVDGETAFRIRVMNHGSSAARTVQVAAEAPAEMRVLRIEGPDAGVVREQQVVFPPIAELAAGETAEYIVVVRCLTPGQARFRAFFRSEDNPEPVLEEEATRIYAD